MATARVFSINEALRWGWEAMRRYLPVTLGLAAVWMLIGFIGDLIGGPTAERVTFVRSLLYTALQLAGLFFGLVWIHVALRIADGEPRPLEGLPVTLWQFFSYLLASVLYGLIVAGGMILFIVPGVLWAIKFGFFGFALVERGLDPIAALRASSQMTRGVKGQLFWFGLALIGINIVGALAFVVGLLATVPVSALAVTYVYRRLAARPVPVEPVLPHLQPSGV
ncbi:MAG TPA: hypothetical protein VH877_22790 [Polyangia bacterium]|jgi:uncharacterized membrane protein|nr:hypothetical protein [Polyangia bacterium]